SEEHTSELQSLTNLVCRPLAIKTFSRQKSNGISVVLNPFAVLFSQASFWADRMSTAPPPMPYRVPRERALLGSAQPRINPDDPANSRPPALHVTITQDDCPAGQKYQPLAR